MKVSITHPGRQHCVHTCEAFAEVRELSCFYTSFAPSRVLPRWAARGALGRMQAWTVPPSIAARTVAHPWPLARMAFVSRLGSGPARERATQDWLHAFDRWVASRIASDPCDVVVGYENACLETFRAARAANKVCVLEAASFHHALESRYLGAAANGLLRERNRRKDAEVALANRVITLSRAARDSYLQAGIEASSLGTVEIGVDLGRFSPPDARQRDASRPFRVLFVGAGSKRKGFDVLLEAFAALDARGAELWWAGDPEMDLPSPSFLKHLGFLDQRELPGVMGSCDVLALPSRFDSFGMAVAEAMACGVPVIVSRNVGAADLVQEGRHGWIVEPANVQSLVRALREAWENLPNLARMGALCVAAVRDRSWDRYRAQLRDECRNAFSGPNSP